MKLPNPPWFTLGMLARRWGVGEDYLEQLIEIRRLKAEVKHGTEQNSTSPIAATDYERCKRLRRYLHDPSRARIEALGLGDVRPRLGSKIIIQLSEVKRMENKEAQPNVNKDTPRYLDPAHKYHSKELAAAIKVWVDLYGNENIKPKKGHKSQIKAALSGYGFTAAAVDRIATLVNPNKAGGAPTSE